MWIEKHDLSTIHPFCHLSAATPLFGVVKKRSCHFTSFACIPLTKRLLNDSFCIDGTFIFRLSSISAVLVKFCRHNWFMIVFLIGGNVRTWFHIHAQLAMNNARYTKGGKMSSVMLYYVFIRIKGSFIEWVNWSFIFKSKWNMSAPFGRFL